MIVAVIGSRSFNDYELLNRTLEGYNISEIISGGAKGADSLAKEYATEKDIQIIEFLPEYDKYGKGAPLERNKTIVDNSDMVIAFWDGKSRGTKFTIDYATRQEKSIEIIKFNNVK